MFKMFTNLPFLLVTTGSAILVYMLLITIYWYWKFYYYSSGIKNVQSANNLPLIGVAHHFTDTSSKSLITNKLLLKIILRLQKLLKKEIE